MIKSNTDKDIIARLGYFRNKCNLSAREVSLRLGYSESWYYRVEAGEIDLKISTVLALVELFGISLEELFYYDIEKYEEDKELLALAREMTKEEKETLCKLIKIKK